MNIITTVTVKAYTMKELAAIYGISSKAFKTWLIPYDEAIGKKRGWYYTTLQVKPIFEKIGLPE